MYQEARRGVYTLHVVGSLIILSALIVLSRSSGLLPVLVACAAAILLFGLIFAPDVFFFLVPLAFAIAGMPALDPGGIFQSIRWVFLLLFGISLIPRGGIASLRRVWDPTYLSLALFLALCVGSVEYSPNRMMTLLKSIAFGVLLLVAAANGALLRNREGRGTRLCYILAFAACAVVVASAIMARSGLTGPGGNFEGPFGNANTLGAFLGLTVPFLFFGAHRGVQPNAIKRMAAWTFLLAAFVFLFASHSRAGIAAAVVASGWWLFFSKRHGAAVLLVAAVFSVLAVNEYYPSLLHSLKHQYVLKKDTSVFQSRDALWRRDFASVEEHPILGGGFGTSGDVSQGWSLSFQTGHWGREKGNSYLSIASEVGMIGALLLLMPVGWVLLRTVRWLAVGPRENSKDPEFWVTLALSACVVGGLVDVFAEAWLTAAGFFGAVIFWIAFGALAARTTRQAPQRAG